MSGASDLRLFVAIDSNDAIRSVAKAARAALEDSLSSAKWVRPENVHLTLRFLGDANPEKVDKIIMALRSGLEVLKCFTAATTSFGAFPNTKKARVVWLGLEDSEQISNLHRQTNAALLEAGIAADNRKFHPHFTIARLRRPGPVRLLQAEHLARPPCRLIIQSVTLYSSTLSPKGPFYERLDQIALLPEHSS